MASSVFWSGFSLFQIYLLFISIFWFHLLIHHFNLLWHCYDLLRFLSEFFLQSNFKIHYSFFTMTPAVLLRSFAPAFSRSSWVVRIFPISFSFHLSQMIARIYIWVLFTFRLIFIFRCSIYFWLWYRQQSKTNPTDVSLVCVWAPLFFKSGKGLWIVISVFVISERHFFPRSKQCFFFTLIDAQTGTSLRRWSTALDHVTWTPPRRSETVWSLHSVGTVSLRVSFSPPPRYRVVPILLLVIRGMVTANFTHILFTMQGSFCALLKFVTLIFTRIKINDFDDYDNDLIWRILKLSCFRFVEPRLPFEILFLSLK